MPNIKLYTIKLDSDKVKKVDNAGRYFTHEGIVDYGVHSGVHPIPLSLARQAIDDIDFPLGWMDIPLYLLPFRLMVFNRGWTGLYYHGRAYPSHIIYGARKEVPTMDSIGDLIIHEIGHALCYRYVDGDFLNYKYTDKFKEYLELRNVPADFRDDHIVWEKRPSELWAEDFRYLFGIGYARNEPFLHYNYVDPPDERVRDFMLSVVPEEFRTGETVVEEVPVKDGIELRMGNREYYVNGAKFEMDTLPFVNEDYRTMVPLRVIAEGFGFEVTPIYNSQGLTEKVIIKPKVTSK